VNFGVRVPSLKKRLAVRTSVKRFVRHSRGLKAPRGWGWLTNPKKAAYNRVYRRTTVGCCMLLIGTVAAAIIATAAQAQGSKRRAQVTFTSACECPTCHAQDRWPEKTVKTQPPVSISADHQLTPSQLRSWNGPGGTFGSQTPRSGKEQEFYQLTGQVRRLVVEADGDLHLQLAARGTPANEGMASAEIPDGEPWCSIRTELLKTVGATFPFSFGSNRIFKVPQDLEVTVVGLAFYDAHHDGGDPTINDRKGAKNSRTTVWEIHPVMKLQVNSH